METIEEQLIPAIKGGDLELVQSLLELPEIKPFVKYLTKSESYAHQGQYYTKDGHLLIHVAAKHGQTAIIRLLFKYFEVDVVNKKLETSMTLAALNNHEDTLLFLLQNGANVHHTPHTGVKSDGQTVLFPACQRKLGNIVRILLQHGAGILRGYDSLMECRRITRSMAIIIAKGGKDIVELLLDSDDFNNKRNFKETLLLALEERNIEMFQVILQKGISKDGFIESLSDCKFLTVVAALQCTFFKILLDAGVDVNPPQDDDWSALHECATGFWAGAILELPKILLENGAYVNNFARRPRKDEIEIAETPLFYAITNRALQMVELLFEYGADINLVNAERINLTLLFHSMDNVTMALSRILCKQIVKLQSEKLLVNAGYLEAINNNEEYKAYVKQCERVIDCMRKHEFADTSVSLYDVFVTRSLVRLAAFANNENILNFVKSDKLSEKFPHYSASVQRHLQRGCHRNYLTRRVCNFFSSLSTRQEHSLPKLPASCVGEIFDLLSNRDLERLRNSYF